MFNPFDYPILFVQPERRTALSAWEEHIPFGMFLVGVQRPRLIVELGTHAGDSYCAFCQAVNAYGLGTQCRAIDTWQGDEHADPYGPEVLADLRGHHDSRYGRFSRLMQSTFDEALPQFADGSIDLLHIDGLHTYEAVKHDFESWLPKVSERGIILFHDITFRERKFGVWKLWEELRNNYPSFEFEHGNGLGILAPHRVEAEIIRHFFQANAEQARLLRGYFRTLGKRLSLVSDLHRSRQAHDQVVSEIKRLTGEYDLKYELLLAETMHLRREYLRLERIVTEQQQSLFSQQERLLSQQAQLDADAIIKMGVGYRSLMAARRLFARMIPEQSSLRVFYHRLRNRDGLVEPMWEDISPVTVPAAVPLTETPYDYSQWMKEHEPMPPHSARVDIVVCVHNALEDLKACLESVVRYTRPPYSLLLVDDGSEEETMLYLGNFAQGQGAKLLRNYPAKGYILAVNQGLRRSRADYVVILNSNTIVTPGWLDRLIACGESDARIGLIGPLSNTASCQSIPIFFDAQGIGAENNLPLEAEVVEMGRLVSRYANRLYPRLPFLNVFCLAIKRCLIEKVGIFDEKAFGAGLGEANDYCLRASQSGFELAVADDVYIHHHQSASYSHEQGKEHSAQYNQALNAKLSEALVQEETAICCQNRVLEGVRVRAQAMLERERLVRLGKEQWEGKRVLFLPPILEQGARLRQENANAILQEAQAMIKMGVDVHLLNYPEHREIFERIYPDPNLPVIYHPRAQSLEGLAGRYDAIVATVNDSVGHLQSLNPARHNLTCGYYIQDFELDLFAADPEEHKKARASYTAFPGLVCFTKTERNRGEIKALLGVECVLVGLSVNLDLFCPRRRQSAHAERLRIAGLIRPMTPDRAPRLTIELLRQLQLEYGQQVEILLFGCAPDDPAFLALLHQFPYVHYGELTRPQLAGVLNETDIFVNFSTNRALGLTALEAMACGAAVIVPGKGGAGNFVTDEENGLIADTASPQECYAALTRLVTNTGLRQRLQRHAQADACRFTPEQAAYHLLTALFPFEASVRDSRQC